jgi:hypothetical protein
MGDSVVSTREAMERGARRSYMPRGSGERWRFEMDGESARRWVERVRGLCCWVSSCHCRFSSSRRDCVSASQIFLERSRSALASEVADSATASRVCSFWAEERCSIRSCSRVWARSLMVSNSSSSRRALELTSLAFRLMSDSRFAVSSRSFSSAVTRDVRVDSMPCQFSEASEYCVCSVSICLSSFA